MEQQKQSIVKQVLATESKLIEVRGQLVENPCIDRFEFRDAIRQLVESVSLLEETVFGEVANG